MKRLGWILASLWPLAGQTRMMTGPYPPAIQEQPGKASIEGTVTDAMTHEPVKKASVMLNGRAHLEAVTDASGHFAFRQLPAGPYTIQAQSERYPQAQNPFDAPQQVTLSLGAEEQKQDMSLTLIPGASVRGRIVDEDGNPMSRCNVSPQQFRETDSGRVLQSIAGFGASDERGEYRITNLPRGKYYILARCNQSLPLPHAFVRRGSAADLPGLKYPPEFYPGSSDAAGAVRVEATPGANASGIDFKMSPVAGVTVRGHVSMAQGSSYVVLTPRDPAFREFREFGRLDQASGEFRIQNVLAGSYELLAMNKAEGQSYFAKVPIQLSATPPDPIELTLSPAPAISGSISIDGDSTIPLKNFHVMLNPLDGQEMTEPRPGAEVQTDGTFTINSALPGHWRLALGGPGYLKSVRQGDQEVDPENFEVGSSGGAPLKIVMGTKFAQMEATLPAASSGNEPVFAMLWASNRSNFQQGMQVNPQGRTAIQVPPGKYYVCAVSAVQPWSLLQNRALRKELESRCESVDAPEGGRASVQLSLIPATDLKKLIEKLDE